MTKKALLITGQESETVSTLARNLIPTGGLSLFARQMLQMKSIGIDEMHVITDWFAQDFEKEMAKCRVKPRDIFIHSTKEAPLKLLEHNDEGSIWFLIEEAVLLDDRIIEQVAINPAPTVISLIGQNEFLSTHTANGISLHLDDQEGYFGSLAKLSRKTLSANVRKLNSLEGLANALKSIARAEDCVIFKVTNTPLYDARYGRNIDLVWLPITRKEDGDHGTEILLDYAKGNIQDVFARYAYGYCENFLVKYMSRFPIFPAHVMAAMSILGFYIMYLFWSGHLLPALFGTYIVGILSGVNDKFIHLKRMSSKLERLGHFMTKVLSFGWYFSIAVFLSRLYGMIPYILAAVIILCHIADSVQMEFFRRMTTLRLYNAAAFDRKFHLIASSSTTQMWILLLFGLYHQWLIGLGFICAYGIITFFVHQARLVYHLKNIMIENSNIFAENFKTTKIL